MSENELAYRDIVGSPARHDGDLLSKCEGIPLILREVLCAEFGDLRLSPPQEQSLQKGLLKDNINLLVSAATNSGKTLIAILRMFNVALEKGRRSVLVVPLKAIAEEKFVEFESLAVRLKERTGASIQIAITTGDYQQSEDFLGSPPPDSGEIVICTPERLEVMLRNPESHEWARSIDTYVIDEFHLLGEPKRGASLELLLTRLMDACPNCSVLALSATITNIDEINIWFDRNGRSLNVVDSDYRYPQLCREVHFAKDKDAFVQTQIGEVIQGEDESLLVFVATQAIARKLAERINESTKGDIAVYFHAGLSLAEKRLRIAAIRSSKTKIVVTTTSLKMGVNFPVTRVIIRDYKLHDGNGRKRLTVSDVLQMMGRAGRRERQGLAILMADNVEDAKDYADKLKDNCVHPIRPQLVKGQSNRFNSKAQESDKVDPISTLALTELALRDQGRQEDVARFVSKSFSAVFVRKEVIDFASTFTSLERSKMIYRVEGSDGLFSATKLGQTVSRCGISPESGSIIAGFLRALITMSEKSSTSGPQQNFIRRLTSIDFLFLSISCYELRESWLAKPSKKAIESTQQFVESLDTDDKPFIYRWRDSEDKEFPTRRLLSTLKIPVEEKTQQQVFYQMLRTAELLFRHSKGVPLAKLADEYEVAVGNLENRLKGTCTWVLSCISQICDPNKAYKLESAKMKAITLLQDLSLGSTLGELLQLKGVGRRTIETVVEAGYTSFDELKLPNLLACGISQKNAILIQSYASRRCR
jgi:helicase